MVKEKSKVETTSRKDMAICIVQIVALISPNLHGSL